MQLIAGRNFKLALALPLQFFGLARQALQCFLLAFALKEHRVPPIMGVPARRCLQQVLLEENEAV